MSRIILRSLCSLVSSTLELLLLFLVFLAGGSSMAKSTRAMTEDQRVLHVLNRVTFGPRPGDIEDVKRMGIERFLEQQLNPSSLPLPDGMLAYLDKVEAINSTPIDLYRKYSPAAVMRDFGSDFSKKDLADKEKYNKLVKENYSRIYTEAAAARLKRAIENSRQLEEVMVDFWFNHFNVSTEKGLDRIWIGAYEEQAIRPFALGKFKDLVSATARHPAMLFYLDNWQNTKADGNKSKGRFKGLNENYARELMELHTLGVDGGYTQKDVIELARILTGLGLPPEKVGLAPQLLPEKMMESSVAMRAGTETRNRPTKGIQIGRFGSCFEPGRHDFGDKLLLGKTIRGSGEGEIDEAIELLCHSHSTASHVSYQLAQYFVADEPPQSLVRKLTDRYEQTDGDISAMLTLLFHSHEFWRPSYENVKFKNPYRYVVSSLRAANVSLADYKPVLGFFKQLGMPLYSCPTPDGYKNTQIAWLSPDSLLKRIQFATGLATGKLPNNQLAPLDYQEVTHSMTGQFSNATLQIVADSPAPLRSALLLGSPEFMKH